MTTSFRIYYSNDNIKFAGTDFPSFFNDIETAKKYCDKSKGEKIIEWSNDCSRAMWEVC